MVSLHRALDGTTSEAHASGNRPAGTLATGVGATVAASGAGNVLIAAILPNLAQEEGGAPASTCRTGCS